jgi:WD40 repeat protein
VQRAPRFGTCADRRSTKAATAGGEAFPIYLWDMKTGKTKRTLVGTGARAWAVAFSADGQRIAWGNTWRTRAVLASNPLEFQLRLPATGLGLGRPEPLGETTARDFARARTTYGNYTGNLVALLKGHSNVVNSVAFWPDGTRLISGSGLEDFRPSSGMSKVTSCSNAGVKARAPMNAMCPPVSSMSSGSCGHADAALFTVREHL